MTADPWQEYLSAAQRLATVRREAAIAAEERASGVEAVRSQLSAVRDRLAPQRTRLRERGVPEVDLVPSPPELSIAARSAGRDPATMLAALRQADERIAAVDATLAGRRWRPLRPSGGWRFRPLGIQLALLAGATFVCAVAAVLLLVG